MRDLVLLYACAGLAFTVICHMPIFLMFAGFNLKLSADRMKLFCRLESRVSQARSELPDCLVAAALAIAISLSLASKAIAWPYFAGRKILRQRGSSA